MKKESTEINKIKRAIIPVAGFGTRMYPITRAIKKSFIPIPDGNTMKPILLKLVEDLDEIGIEEIALVVGPQEKSEYEEFFNKTLADDHLDKLSLEMRDYDSNILRLGRKITYIVQEERLGFGHAIHLCKDFAQNEAVLVVLGDTYFTTKSDKSCVEQIVDYYDETKGIVIGMCEATDDEIENIAVMSGSWDDSEKTKLSVNKMVEKPTIEYAKKELQMEGKCYGNFGIWIINNDVFKQIEFNIENNIMSQGEYQFVDAIADIMDKVPVKALKINGQSHDVGNIRCYQKTLLTELIKATNFEFTSENNEETQPNDTDWNVN